MKYDYISMFIHVFLKWPMRSLDEVATAAVLTHDWDLSQTIQ